MPCLICFERQSTPSREGKHRLACYFAWYLLLRCWTTVALYIRVLSNGQLKTLMYFIGILEVYEQKEEIGNNLSLTLYVRNMISYGTWNHTCNLRQMSLQEQQQQSNGHRGHHRCQAPTGTWLLRGNLLCMCQLAIAAVHTAPAGCPINWNCRNCLPYRDPDKIIPLQTNTPAWIRATWTFLRTNRHSKI